MGYGSYTASDWQKLRKSKNLESSKNVQEIFGRTKCNPKFDPKYIGTRECFDSEDHPETTPIVIGLDVTASMGYLAVNIAKKSLNELIMKLFSTGAVRDPALMCAAYGDYLDQSPLQVTQFESDIRIVEQMLDLYFENRGQGSVVPGCLWHFLSNHTNIDAIKKRGKKGFVFTIGDNAMIRSSGVSETIQKVTGDKLRFTSLKKILGKTQENFNVFHIMVGGTNIVNNDLLAGHTITISKDEIDCIAEIIISTIQLQNGMEFDQVIAQWDEIERPVISAAVRQLRLSNTGKRIKL